MVSIKRILCPIDFSEFSRHALIRAAAIAKAHGASITAVHVLPTGSPLITAPLEAIVPAAYELTSGEREHLRQELAAFVRPAVSTGVAIESDIIEAPTVHGELLAQAGRLHADLIVMGSHGRSGFQRLLLGSVTEKVLRTAEQPVLTVGAFADGVADASSFTRMLCAVDFSECSIAALRYALTLAEGSDARLTAVNVIEWTPIGYDPLLGPPSDLAGYRIGAEAAARERLHKTIGDVSPSTVAVEEVVISGKAHHEILRIAAEQRSDLIVLGVHGRNPVGRVLFGSTVEPVVRRATCPVLTVRADPSAKIAAA